ncbi:hypothetical protein ACH5RR_005834 [Cinchona calisaya]|uniref:Phytocyanin domain-containing protein n=1 Tax=Cinchona calisaya TaxID=153742 RepID=A0ABD3AMA0_9GENT
MARKLNMSLFIVAILAAALHCSVAQRTHVVGNSLGWTVPPGGPTAYSTWASQQTFSVGDVLVFNFTTGTHDVAEVTRSSFDGCNTTSPMSLNTNGPANITLMTAGEHHYICTFSGHCNVGQKLAINVSAAPSTSPAPQPGPATPPPVPAPSPSRTPQTYVVGDSLGWLVPPGGPIAYQTWASNKTFVVGDVLVFNFTSGAHNVAVVTSKAAYDSCNTSATSTTITTSPARINLTNPGEHFYICTFPQHCSLGQKLAINVTGTASTPSPTPSPATPPSSPTPAPAPSSPGATPPSPSGSTTPAPSGSTTPSTPSTPSPSGVSAPPPPSSAPSFAVAALPFTFLSIVLALFY